MGLATVVPTVHTKQVCTHLGRHIGRGLAVSLDDFLRWFQGTVHSRTVLRFLSLFVQMECPSRKSSLTGPVAYPFCLLCVRLTAEWSHPFARAQGIFVSSCVTMG